MQSTAWLLAAAALLGYAAFRMGRLLQRVSTKWQRPVAILTGGMGGVALCIPVALVLDPFVGIQKGTYFNQMALVLSLGFLGVVVGSLGGLAFVGMIHPPEPRIKQDSFDQELASRMRGGQRGTRQAAEGKPSGETRD